MTRILGRLVEECVIGYPYPVGTTAPKAGPLRLESSSPEQALDMGQRRRMPCASLEFWAAGRKDVVQMAGGKRRRSIRGWLLIGTMAAECKRILAQAIAWHLGGDHLRAWGSTSELLERAETEVRSQAVRAGLEIERGRSWRPEATGTMHEGKDPCR